MEVKYYNIVYESSEAHIYLMWVGLHLGFIPGLIDSFKEFVISSISTEILNFSLP